MSNEPLKYSAISVIQGDIYCSPDSTQQIESRIMLFEDEPEGYKIFAVLSSSSGRTLLRKLVLEKIFYSKQDCRDFHEYAQKQIKRFFARIKFLTGEYSATIDNSHEIECPEGRYRFDEFGEGEGFSSKILVFLKETDFEQLGNIKNESLDEYIKRYNLAIQFSDSVLRLISLYGVAELIAYEKAHKKQEIDVFINQHLQIDHLISCVRHLVAHGVVDSKKTLPCLIEALDLASESASIKFSREDRRQMNLVEKSASRIAAVLKQYLEGQLLES